MDQLINQIKNNKKTLFVAAGAIGGLLSGFWSILFSLHENSFTSWVLTGALDAALIGALIVCGQTYYQTKKMVDAEKLKTSLKNGALFGAGGGLVALFAMDLFSQGEIGRFIGWAISGGVAGYVVSRQVPNMQKTHAIAAGAIGATVGCAIMSINLGYVTGVVITGAAIGFVVVSAEEIMRKSWVQITEYSEILKTGGINMAKVNNEYTLTLGSEPIRIGYSADMDIRIKATGIAMEKEVSQLTVESGKVFMTDLKSGAKSELLQGSPIKIQNCELSIHNK